MKRIIATISFAVVALCASAQTETTTETQDSISTEQLFQQLPDVMVRGERPIAKMERGALVYDMPLLLEQIAADNAYEALTRIPDVVEANGNIEFAGSAITLIINGRATTLSADQIVEHLKQMPANRLAKCEVMMSAPARYHVRGAVINIVTTDLYNQRRLSGQITGAYQAKQYYA